MRVLGIESSCDDTAAAVYDSSAGLLANIVSSQVPVHSLYGGGVFAHPLPGADPLEAHIFSIFLEQEVPFPFVALLVSGGHTSLFRVSGWEEVFFLGGTLDDAAGGALHKASKTLGLGYPRGRD